MKKMATSNILISGLKGLGVEIGKIFIMSQSWCIETLCKHITVGIDVPFQNIATSFNGIVLMVNCVVSQTAAEFVF